MKIRQNIQIFLTHFHNFREKIWKFRNERSLVIVPWPGGKVEAGESPEGSLVREIQEEVGCEADVESFSFLATYEAPASGEPEKTVRIDLFQGNIFGAPRANSEIVKLGWLGKEDVENPKASEMIREHILPDLVKRGILV